MQSESGSLFPITLIVSEEGSSVFGARHALILFSAAALLLMPSFASAEITIAYAGEIPGAGPGTNALWDYVYDFADDGSAGGGYRAWAIRVSCEIDLGTIYHPDDWTGSYSGNMNTVNPLFPAVPGVYWETTTTGPSTGTFGYQSGCAPGMNDWGAMDGNGLYAGETWSANPEPASIALASLALLGVGWWRRRSR